MSVTDAAADPGTRSPRAERTRTLIADALLSLLEEGDLQPTATRIAERAGISLRLIYHHFGDLEGLFRVLAQREAYLISRRTEPLPTDGPLAGRLDAFVEQRTRVLEWLTPVMRAAALHEPFSQALRDARDAGYLFAEHEVLRVFALELGPLSPDERQGRLDSIAGVTSWSAWNSLRVSGRSVERATAALRRTLALLLAAPPG